MTGRGTQSWPRTVLWTAAPAVLGLLLWAAVAAVVRPRAPLPGPVETAGRLVELLSGQPLLDHTIFTHAVASLARWIVGFLIGATVGMAVATLIGWSRVAERLLMPMVYVAQLIPGLAWIPIAILLFGIGNTATVFMIVLTALSPVAVNMVAGLKSASEDHLRVARMAGARARDTFRHVLLPGSIPHLLSGLRVGLGNSWRVVVAAEMVVGTGTGLGYSIIQSRWTLDYSSAFVCIILICVVGLLIEYLGFAKLEEATIRRWGMVQAS